MLESSIDFLSEQLVEISRNLFYSRGIRGVSVEDISKEIGISKKTFYKYFESKEALIKFHVENYIQNDKKAYNDFSLNSKNAIEVLFKIFKFNLQHYRNLQPVFLEELQKYAPKLWKILENHLYVEIPENIKSNLNRGIEEQLYRKNIDINFITFLYSKNIFNSLDYFLENNAISISDIFMNLFIYHIKGISTPKGLELLDQIISMNKFS